MIIINYIDAMLADYYYYMYIYYVHAGHVIDILFIIIKLCTVIIPYQVSRISIYYERLSIFIENKYI